MAEGVEEDLQRRLAMAQSQLKMYAHDFRQTVDAERQRSRELAEANVRLRVLDRLKTDFLIFISHELRTPLVAMGAVDILAYASDPEQQAELVGIMRDGYERLVAFIEKGLKYFRWLAEEPVDTTQATDLAALARELGGEPVTVRVSPEGAACLVRGRRDDLTEVVAALLNNARKVSPPGGPIEAVVTLDAGTIVLTVTDQGDGFPPEMAEELFQPFTIANVNHHGRGSGLSLALAAAIVAAYGGRISARSEGTGRGAAFTVELPAAP